MIHSLAIAAIIGYTLALLLFLWAVVRALGRKPEYVLSVGVLCHLLLLIILGLANSDSGIESRSGYYALLSILFPGGYLGLSRKKSYPSFGACACGLAAVFLISSAILAHTPSNQPAGHLDIHILILHILPALWGEASLLFAFIAGIFYLVQERRIRNKEVAVLLESSPSIQFLGRFMTRAIAMGFIALSLAILSGVIWGALAGRPLLGTDRGQWFALVAWIGVGAIAHLRFTSRMPLRIVATSIVIVGSIISLAILWLMFTAGNEFHE